MEAHYDRILSYLPRVFSLSVEALFARKCRS